MARSTTCDRSGELSGGRVKLEHACCSRRRELATWNITSITFRRLQSAAQRDLGSCCL